MEPLDLTSFGERLRKTRLQRHKTLKDVSGETGISVPTLSRIERGAANEIESKTLITISNWVGVSVNLFSTSSAPSALQQSLPDIVDMQLRGDKTLDEKSGLLLAKMFRVGYELAKKQNRKKR